MDSGHGDTPSAIKKDPLRVLFYGGLGSVNESMLTKSATADFGREASAYRRRAISSVARDEKHALSVFFAIPPRPPTRKKSI